MSAQKIIILSQIDNTVSLYINCFKSGYNKLYFFQTGYQKYAVNLRHPEITLSELMPGRYYLYCKNDDNEETGDIYFEVDYSTQTERLNNILIANDLYKSPYTNIVTSLKTVDYILELYNQYITVNDNKEEYETLLSVLTSDYNMRQENLNLFVNPLFITDRQTGNIVSYYTLPYTYMPYRYNAETKNWDILQKQIVRNTDMFDTSGLSEGLHKIVVTLNGKLVRSFFIYMPPAETIKTQIQQRIDQRKIEIEKSNELVETLNEEEFDQNIYKTVAAILEFDPVKPLLRRPEIELDNFTVTVTIPDYDLIMLTESNFYLAFLEISEIYAKQITPHKIPITSHNFQFNALLYLPNSDTEYITYIIDGNNTILSQVVMISFNPDYSLEECITLYRKIELDRYTRKLYSVFKEYDPQEWGIVSSTANRYFLNGEQIESFSDFMLRQITHLDQNQYDISFIMQQIILCKLQYFTNIDQNFVPQQVYMKLYNSHVFPRSDTRYIIRVVKINGDSISYQYLMSGNSGTEVRIDRSDITILQAIDPKTWKVSPAAFYNRRYNGAKYFYFPKLEVTINNGF